MSKHAREASKQDANKAQPFSGDLGSTTCHRVSKRHTTVTDRIVNVDVYVNVDGLSLFPDTLLEHRTGWRTEPGTRCPLRGREAQPKPPQAYLTVR
jgi:hypothetical protein